MKEISFYISISEKNSVEQSIRHTFPLGELEALGTANERFCIAFANHANELIKRLAAGNNWGRKYFLTPVGAWVLTMPQAEPGQPIDAEYEDPQETLTNDR